ncbi:MAG: IS1595 family transposase ISNwi1 [Bacteroidia bacterium]|nr:IS1595 family transposase ISNwi1 [Bacteroidia bacterium]
MENLSQALQFKSFAHMLEVLSTETHCRVFLENLRWTGSPICPHCGVQDADHYQLKDKGVFKGLYKCKDCRQRFTVTVGTMFEGSHLPLRKWFIAIYIFASHKKGISSHQLSRDLGITQKTAWFVLGRLRNSFKSKTKVKFTGVTQADESFVGGKNINRHANKKIENAQGRSVKDKTPVFGLLSDGKVCTSVVPDTKAQTLKPIISELVEKGAIMVTDEWTAYAGLSKDYQHEVVKHKSGEYVKNNLHTNSLEGFWSLLKRGIFGIYHQVSPEHLNRYCDEFSYRYNTRQLSDANRFNLSLFNADERLTYKQLTAKN